MNRLRAACRCVALFLLLAACLPPHLASKLVLSRSRWPRRFLGAAGWICGARVNVDGRPLPNHALLISNHVSWLDILVLAGATGCAFVSKEELRAQPLIRWLADQNHTIYVRRSARKETARQAQEIADALHSPRPLALFPEGTTGPGDRLLQFRPALLSAVTPPPRDIEVRPVAIDYGAAMPEIGWHGEKGVQNVLRILGRKGGIPVTVHLLPPIEHREDRKRLAQEAREAIGNALASSRGAAPLYAPAK